MILFIAYIFKRCNTFILCLKTFLKNRCIKIIEFDKEGNIKPQIINKVIKHSALLECEIREARKLREQRLNQCLRN